MSRVVDALAHAEQLRQLYAPNPLARLHHLIDPCDRLAERVHALAQRPTRSDAETAAAQADAIARELRQIAASMPRGGPGDGT